MMERNVDALFVVNKNRRGNNNCRSVKGKTKPNEGHGTVTGCKMLCGRWQILEEL